ncbi:MAG TPA: hypothetical protein VFT99_04550, partial [Roseiflexaceae bacterium]|nr:hypothetical protein [Roseiflexaceae bacterium]
MLRISLFGTPRIERDGHALPLRRTKALALLAYLALADQPKDRDSLLALLWPEFDEPSARNNLRRELSLLRSHLHADLLIADRLQVRWNPQAACWVDVTSFHEQVATWREHGHGDDALCADCAAALETAARLAG